MQKERQEPIFRFFFDLVSIAWKQYIDYYQKQKINLYICTLNFL